MSHKEMLKSGEIYFEKKIDINNVNTKNILVSYKYHVVEACWKYFNSYVNHFNDEIKPAPIKLPRLSGSIKSFLKVKLYHLCFKKNKDKLNEYAKICNRIKDLIGTFLILM